MSAPFQGTERPAQPLIQAGLLLVHLSISGRRTRLEARQARRAYAHIGIKKQKPGGAFESEDLPDRPGLRFIRPDNQSDWACPTQNSGLDFAPACFKGAVKRL
jgi:hypothetical protein